MIDPFLPALADIKASLDAGEYVEDAIRDAAEEHKLPTVALRNRARLAWGSLGERRKQAIRTADQRQEEADYRRAVSIFRMIHSTRKKDQEALARADREWLNIWERRVSRERFISAKWDGIYRSWR